MRLESIAESVERSVCMVFVELEDIALGTGKGRNLNMNIQVRWEARCDSRRLAQAGLLQ